jgi:PAS domain S-box-containing protein
VSISDPIAHPGRVEALDRLGLLDTPPEEAFDRLTRLAAACLKAPMALISLVHLDRQFIKSSVGLPEPWETRRQMPLAESLCQHVVRCGAPCIIPDLRQHPLVSDISSVAEIGVAAYLGIPLVTEGGQPIGVLCTLDSDRRIWTNGDIASLTDVAAVVMREIELRGVLHRQAALLESTGEGIYGVDLNGCCTFINRAAAQMFGFRSDEILGLNMHQFTHHHFPDGRPYPQDRCRIFTAFRRGEGVRASDEVFWRQDGTSFPAEYSSFPLIENGKVTGAIITFSDITERREAEEVLQASEEVFRCLSACSPVGIFLTDTAGRCTYTNPSCQAICGFTLEESLGEGWAAYVHPEDRARVFDEWSLTTKAGRTYSDEFRFEDPEHGIRWVHVRSSPMISDTGTLIGHVGTVEDITERKRAEGEREQFLAELAAERARLEAVLQQMPAGVLIAEAPSGRIIMGNQLAEEICRHQIRYSAGVEAYDEWVGFHLDGRQVRSDEWPLARAITHGETVTGEEYEYLRGDGTRCVLSLNAGPIRDHQGHIIAGVLAAHDVTERTRAEHALRFLAEASTMLSGSLDYEATLKSLIQLVVPDFADWCSIIIGEDGSACRRAVTHVDPMKVDRLQELHRRYPMIANPRHPVQQVLQSKQVLLVPDVTDALLQQIASDRVHLQVMRDLDPRSVIIAPLVAQVRLVGLMVCAYAESGRSYQSRDLGLFTDLAAHAAVALDNARLYQKLADRERQLQSLVERLLVAHEEERRRAAYEVHDGVAQVAASAHQHLQAFAGYHRPRSREARQKLQRALELAQRTVREARVIVANLRPTTLDDFGLAAALRLQVEELECEGWDVKYQQGLGEERLPPAVETALFRVAQKSLTNVRKHSKSTTVEIVVHRGAQTVSLEIRDQGVGFDPEDIPHDTGPRDRVGLAGMRERILLLGGEFRVQSQPGTGTRVIATVPVPEASVRQE